MSERSWSAFSPEVLVQSLLFYWPSRCFICCAHERRSRTLSAILKPSIRLTTALPRCGVRSTTSDFTYGNVVEPPFASGSTAWSYCLLQWFCFSRKVHCFISVHAFSRTRSHLFRVPHSGC